MKNNGLQRRDCLCVLGSPSSGTPLCMSLGLACLVDTIGSFLNLTILSSVWARQESELLLADPARKEKQNRTRDFLANFLDPLPANFLPVFAMMAPGVPHSVPISASRCLALGRRTFSSCLAGCRRQCRGPKKSGPSHPGEPQVCFQHTKRLAVRWPSF